MHIMRHKGNGYPVTVYSSPMGELTHLRDPELILAHMCTETAITDNKQLA